MDLISKIFFIQEAHAAPGIFSWLSGGEPPVASDLVTFLDTVKNMALSAAGAVALVFIIWGIIQLFTSGGDQTKVGKARGIIFAAVIGLSIIIAAAYLTNTFANVLSGN